MSRINQANKQNQEKVQKALARFVCCDSVHPHSCCDEDGAFRRLLRTLNPSFLPSFNSLEHDCLEVYAEDREKVREFFSELGGHVSLSVDSLVHEERWESCDEYMCLLSAHFIDDDWKLQKWVIKYCAVPDENNNIEHEIIVRSLKEWGIEGKLFTITDGGISDLVEVVEEEIQEKRKLPMNGKLFHVRCCSYIIGRMVEKGYKEIREIIDKVQLLYWSKSEPLWYLTSSKLRSALELNATGEFSSKRIRQDYDVPSKEEWGKVRSMCRIADKIYDIIEGLFEVDMPTANLFLPHLQEIRVYLIQELGSSDEFVKVVVQKMLKTFNKYWKDMYLVLAIAAFMDPRYKMKFIEFCSSKLEGDDDDLKATRVLQTIRKLYDGYVIQSCQKDYLLSESEEEEEEEEEELEEEDGMGFDTHVEKKCIKLLEKLNILSEYGSSMQSTNNQPPKSDLDLYLEEPVYPWTEKFSVLHWWKDNCYKYPHLSRMARDFLAIPMSVPTSYDAYYTEPREADRTLLSLKPDLMNALKCTRSWKMRFNED